MKKSISHWNLHYLLNRNGLFWFEKKNPNLPWLTKDSINLLEELISKNDKMLEIGAGRVQFSSQKGLTLYFQLKQMKNGITK